MRYTEPDESASRTDVNEYDEEALRRENEELRRQLRELRGDAPHADHVAGPIWRPPKSVIVALLLLALTLVALAFAAGYLPMRERRSLVISETEAQQRELPRVQVWQVERSTRNRDLELPGNIQAITEAPVLARADGYIRTRLVDLGDRVKAGQPLAEIDAPELDEQVSQAKANLEQARAALEQATANLEQGRSDLNLARLAAQRWGALVERGAVSRHENDQYQMQHQSKAANVRSLEKALNVQRSSIAAAEANVARLEKVQAYRVVKAPFDGVITLRNVDTGALVNAGNTLLFRIAQTQTMRTYLSVPQTHANSVRPGQTATVRVSSLPGRVFTGKVARSASALDPASRTLLVEVHVANGDGSLLPGMYAQVDLNAPRTDAPLLVPSDSLVLRSQGAQVAVVRPGGIVHLQKIQIGRDYGDRLEVLGGLTEGDSVVQNPGDSLQEGMRVEPVPMADPKAENAH